MSVTKIVLSVLGACVLLLLGIYWFAPMPKIEPVAKEDLPWHVEKVDGQHRVLGVTLGQTSLVDLEQRFGEVDGLALFSREGTHRLEAYYEKFERAGFKAKVIANLSAPALVVQRLFDEAQDVKGTPSGALRIELREADKPQLTQAVVDGLTYIPAYSKLDGEMLAERFGKPPKVRDLQQGIQQWDYPERGIRVIWNQDGKEIFEFRKAGSTFAMDE